MTVAEKAVWLALYGAIWAKESSRDVFELTTDTLVKRAGKCAQQASIGLRMLDKYAFTTDDTDDTEGNDHARCVLADAGGEP